MIYNTLLFKLIHDLKIYLDICRLFLTIRPPDAVEKLQVDTFIT